MINIVLFVFRKPPSGKLDWDYKGSNLACWSVLDLLISINSMGVDDEFYNNY